MNSVCVDFSGREELSAACQIRPSRSKYRYDQFLPIPALQSPLWYDINYTWQQAAWYISYCNLLGLTELSPLACFACLIPSYVVSPNLWKQRNWFWESYSREGVAGDVKSRTNFAFQWSQSCFGAPLSKSLMLFVLVQLLGEGKLSID